MLLLPGDLIDPDVVKLGEPVGIEFVVADALDDPPDRSPIDPQHPRDRRLVRARRQPPDETFEVASELRPRASERHRLGPRAVHRAPKPPALAAKLQPPGAEVEMPPARHLRPRVLARPRRMPALRADQPLATKRHLNDHRVRPEPDPLHHHPGAETQKPGKCRRETRTLSLLASRLTFRQPAACRSGRRARRPRVRNVREVLQPAKALLNRTIRLSPCPHSCQEPPFLVCCPLARASA